MQNLSTSLLNKPCIPCKEGTHPLTAEAINKLLKELGGDWSLNTKGHLCKEYKLANFMEAMQLANKIAEVAEKEGHHPNLSISWGKCAIEIWTHKIQGLTESDFILAAKIQQVWLKLLNH